MTNSEEDKGASLEVQAKHTDWEDEAEERMNIIGQNGNNGEHYEESPIVDNSINNLTILELENLLAETSKPNKYGPKGWTTIKKRINELKSLNEKNDDDDLIIKY